MFNWEFETSYDNNKMIYFSPLFMSHFIIINVNIPTYIIKILNH